MGGLDNLKFRLGYLGNTQDDRNVKEKLLSLQSALKNSYQAEWIHLDRDNSKCRCLINPNKQNENVDSKSISIEFSYGMREGDTFYWDRTNSHWLVYMQRFTQEAYFEATIERCDYQIDVNDNKYWVYAKGPIVSGTQWYGAKGIEHNSMNYTLVLNITKNEETLAYFDRLNIVKFDGHNWRIGATDKYSQPGIIQLYLEEYHDKAMEDAMIKPEPIESEITGPQIVYCYDTNLQYAVTGESQGRWEVAPASKAIITSFTSDSCSIDIKASRSCKITLSYITDNDRIDLPITVQSI
jgi:hypothetical protein